MADERKEGPGARDPRRRHDAWRSAQFFGLLIAAIAGFNLLLYWERGSKLALAVAALAVVSLVGWLVYARRVIRNL
jgi:hypothetical protein